MLVVQTAFSTVMTAIGVLCTIVILAFCAYAIFWPEQLEVAVPQITEAINHSASNAQALVQNLMNKI